MLVVVICILVVDVVMLVIDVLIYGVERSNTFDMAVVVLARVAARESDFLAKTIASSIKR